MASTGTVHSRRWLTRTHLQTQHIQHGACEGGVSGTVTGHRRAPSVGELSAGDCEAYVYADACAHASAAVRDRAPLTKCSCGRASCKDRCGDRSAEHLQSSAQWQVTPGIQTLLQPVRVNSPGIRPDQLVVLVEVVGRATIW